MDNVAHALIGVGLARAGLAQKYGRGTTLTLAVASNLPDIDILWTIWDRFDFFTMRRTHSHSLLALPVLAALYVLVARPWMRHIPPVKLFALAALGIAGHLLFDLVNAFGVVLLWPFTRARFELSSVFIIDLGVWALALAPIVLARWSRNPPAVFRWSLAALAVYVGLCTAARVRAEAIVAAEAPAGAIVRVFPEPLGPHRFRAAVKSDGAWTLYLVRVLSGTAERHAVVPDESHSPRVTACRCTPHGLIIDWFAGAPAWTERDDGSVEARDLRFESIVVPRPNPFRLRFPAEGGAPVFE